MWCRLNSCSLCMFLSLFKHCSDCRPLQQKKHMKCKSDPSHIWRRLNAIPIGFLQIRLSPDSLAVLCLLRLSQWRKCIRAVEQDPCCVMSSRGAELHRGVCFVRHSSSLPWLDSVIGRGSRWWISVSHASELESHLTGVRSHWRLRRPHSDSCRYCRLGMYGHTNPIWSLVYLKWWETNLQPWSH